MISRSTRTLLVALAIGLAFSATTSQADAGNTTCQLRRPVCNRVYVIRGAAGWWPKIHTMIDRLKRAGYEPDVYLFAQVNHAVDNLIERRRCGEEAGPVRIIGYSLGGHGAYNMAMQLKPYGICVDRLLLIECFSNPTITSNVRCCLNIYETRSTDNWLIFRGTPVQRESCRTHLVNLNVATHPGWRKQRDCNHFTMADSDRVQNTVVHLLSCNCIWRHQHAPSCSHHASTVQVPKVTQVSGEAEELDSSSPE
ncbi:MAG: hypothetical protein R3C02_14935 [Planctomycetaceae bacterium]